MRAERPDFIKTGYAIHRPLAAETPPPLAADPGIAVRIVEIIDGPRAAPAADARSAASG